MGRKLTDEIRDVAKGWRWGRRTMIPRSAESSTPPPKRWDFPTDWARSDAAGVARDLILDVGLRSIIWNETSPEVFGLDNLEGLKGPVMFISNHSSHLDASIIMITLPKHWREVPMPIVPIAIEAKNRRGALVLRGQVVKLME